MKIKNEPIIETKSTRNPNSTELVIEEIIDVIERIIQKNIVEIVDDMAKCIIIYTENQIANKNPPFETEMWKQPENDGLLCSTVPLREKNRKSDAKYPKER